jgi:hypothetical protein
MRALRRCSVIAQPQAERIADATYLLMRLAVLGAPAKGRRVVKAKADLRDAIAEALRMTALEIASDVQQALG